MPGTVFAEALDRYIDPRTEEVYVHPRSARIVVVTHKALRAKHPLSKVTEISPTDVGIFRLAARFFPTNPFVDLELVGTPQSRIVPGVPDELRKSISSLERDWAPLGIFYSEKFSVVVIEFRDRLDFEDIPSLGDGIWILRDTGEDEHKILLVTKETWLAETVLWTKHPEDAYSTKWDLRTLFCLPLL